MTIAALPSTLFQRLHRFFRPDLTERLLTREDNPEIHAAVQYMRKEELPVAQTTAEESHEQEPARIVVFEQAGTAASPIIRWTTSGESDTACFSLERSTDGQQWRSVHLAAATGGAHRGATYAVPVQPARSGKQLFRIRQTLLDGVALLSDILTMEPAAGKAARVSILPDAITDFLHLRLSDPQPASITLRNAQGETVTGTVVQGPTARIDLGGLSRGVHFLHFSQAGMEQILRFEKE